MSSAKSSATKQKKQKKPVFPHLEDRSEFIPYFSHYNEHTLLTKNGELLQTIKIDSNILNKSCENLDGTHASVCSTIRQVISGVGLTNKFSFWLHTIRRRIPMGYSSSVKGADAASDFVEYLNVQWQKKHSWKYNYQNEVYLTIVYEGQDIPLIDKKRLVGAFLPKRSRRFYNKYIDDIYPILDKTCLAILEGITSQCSAKRLGLVERSPASTGKVAKPSIFYSEPMEFLGQILNLVPEDFPLPDVDLSVGLQTSQLVFGFNGIEARNRATGKRYFSSMLRLKQYIDMPIDSIDCVLQAPMEFIISQSFSFVPAARALKHFKAQSSFFGMSGDIKSNDSFGINKVLSLNHNKAADFVEYQTNIMILTDDLRLLDKEVANFFNKFSKLGLVVVREDIQTEEAFWAQFPSNFEFIRRLDYLPTEQIGAFSRLNCFHSGIANNNHWGERLALIPTSVNSPYFFNFHVQDNGHTIMFDFNSFDDNIGKILEYFLLTKARKLNARLFVFDKNRTARLLLNKLKGTYYPMIQLEKVSSDNLVDKTLHLSLNPFSLPPSNYNSSFLAAWCGLLISPDIKLDEKGKAVLSKAVEHLYTLPDTERNLPKMVSLVVRADPALGESLERWIGEGEYSGLFDFAEDSMDVGVDIFGLDLTSALAKSAFALPLFSYVMHRVIDTIDGRPTVIAINEAWDLLENDFFSPRLESLFEMLRQKNVMVFITTSDPQSRSKTSILSSIMSAAATRIYVPDEMAIDYKSDDLGLNDYDAVQLLGMDRTKGDFLVKQQSESISLCVSVEVMEDVTAIFTNDTKSIISARGLFAGEPKDY